VHAPKPSSAAVRALRELDGVIAGYRADIAVLERSRDTSERRLAQHPDRCDIHDLRSPCAGAIYARYCRYCAEV
jgi:hypothetical protein